MKILESSRVTGSNEMLELSPRLAEMKHNIRESIIDFATPTRLISSPNVMRSIFPGANAPHA